MKEALKLPSCIHVRRIGHYSYGPDSEYDVFGELAPVTWMCDCGHRLTLERYDYDEDRYIPVSQDRKDLFLAEHTNCTAKCYNCKAVPVTRQGYWCEKCEEDNHSY